MTALQWLFSRVELHHNAILAIAALMSPFVAIWLGMRQAKANLQTAKLQIRATVGVAYRQQLRDELRKELSAQLDCMNSMSNWHNTGDPREVFRGYAAQSTQRAFRIGLLVTAKNPYAARFFELSKGFIDSIVGPNQLASQEASGSKSVTINEVGNSAHHILEWEADQAKID